MKKNKNTINNNNYKELKNSTIWKIKGGMKIQCLYCFRILMSANTSNLSHNL